MSVERGAFSSVERGACSSVEQGDPSLTPDGCRASHAKSVDRAASAARTIVVTEARSGCTSASARACMACFISRRAE
jgi:hypothetical protein|eukprot:COSAG01_NODE_3338_length_6234_cov_2.176691_4_plen_77_part_00